MLTQIATGVFSPDEPALSGLVDSLINFGDHYQVLADYRSYVDCQDRVDELYRQQEKWTCVAMHNIANMGYFSSDRTIKEYAENIWHIDPVRLKTKPGGAALTGPTGSSRPGKAEPPPGFTSRRQRQLTLPACCSNHCATRDCCSAFSHIPSLVRRQMASSRRRTHSCSTR